ncbi:antitoxin VbhA family protein [Sphingomonas sp. UYP23]
MTMPDLSDKERVGRQRAVDFARTSTELSGGKLTSEFDALNRRFVAGELSETDHIEALLAHARSLPASEPVQEYFASLNEAMTTARGR